MNRRIAELIEEYHQQQAIASPDGPLKPLDQYPNQTPPPLSPEQRAAFGRSGAILVELGPLLDQQTAEFYDRA